MKICPQTNKECYSTGCVIAFNGCCLQEQYPPTPTTDSGEEIYTIIISGDKTYAYRNNQMIDLSELPYVITSKPLNS